MGWVEGHQPPDYGLGHGERTQTTVWEIASVTQAERKEFNHSTPKPVGLFTTPIVKHLKPNEIAYEPFAGTGPQFIAAEQTARRCFGMDLEPVCCQTIIDRWEQFTGQSAVKVGEAVRQPSTPKVKGGPTRAPARQTRSRQTPPPAPQSPARRGRPAARARDQSA